MSLKRWTRCREGLGTSPSWYTAGTSFPCALDHVRSHDASSSPSSDTVGRSGMFCAITMVTQQCKTEGVVDVFQSVKSIRTQKPGAVLTVVSHTSCVMHPTWLPALCLHGYRTNTRVSSRPWLCFLISSISTQTSDEKNDQSI